MRRIWVSMIGIAAVLALSVNGYGVTTQYIYDELNRLDQEQWPDGTIVRHIYDEAGNRLRVTLTPPALDSDGDGLPDKTENFTCTDPNDTDTDDDGIPDGVEDTNMNGVVNAGETNPCNIDSDGDGVQDGTELGYTLAQAGPDTDLSKFKPDLNPSTVTNPLNADNDGDGLWDGDEDVNFNGRVDAGEQDPNFADCDYLLHDKTIYAGSTRQFVTECSIEAGPAFVIEAGAIVTFQAGTRISLKPGFKSNVGCSFHATIGQ